MRSEAGLPICYAHRSLSCVGPLTPHASRLTAHAYLSLMLLPRPTPFDLVFAELADSRFPAIRDALAAMGRDARDRDAFLMTRPAVELVRELRPEEGLGDGMDQLVSLAHHAFLYWLGGELVLSVPPERLDAFLADGNGEAADPSPATSWYAQFPERKIWAEVVEGASHEPLDGLFVHPLDGGGLRVLGAFGMRAEREGFSVVETEGLRSERLERPDRSALFSPVLPGAGSAGLHAITGAEELLELAWRTRPLAGATALSDA